VASYWPLFDLRLETERLVLRAVTDDDLPGLLDAIDAGIHDPELMPFSIPFTDEAPGKRRLSSAQYVWGARANWSTEAWELPFGVFRDGRPIGVQGVTGKRFLVLREVETGSWLTRAEQGQGFGKEMRCAVLQFAFEHLNAQIARSGAFVDNPASAAVSRAIGYRENGHSREAPRGAPKERVNFELTREDWLQRRESLPRATVVGFDAARPMFGLDDDKAS
jgi:RimJ/RimL family protein N-acetyltransferase